MFVITRTGTLICSVALVTSGCSGWQTALDPHSGEAAKLARLFWFFTIVCALVWLAVMGALAYAGARARATDDIPEEDSPDRKRRKTWGVSSAVGATALILLVFTVTSFYMTRSFAWPDTKALTIKVTGHQWWWLMAAARFLFTLVLQTLAFIYLPECVR